LLERTKTAGGFACKEALHPLADNVGDGDIAGVWSTTYSDPAYFDWLLAQRRTTF